MQKSRFKLFLIIVYSIMILGCSPITNLLIKAYSHPDEIIDTEGMCDYPSPYNDDNRVYKTHSTFGFDVHQINKFDTIDFKLEMLVIPGQGNRKESKIKYKYYYKRDYLSGIDSLVENTEITSLNETANHWDFHPPRSNSLKKLELAPFPDMPYTISKNSKKRTFLLIPKGNWGEWGGSKFKREYKIDTVVFKQDTIPYSWVINATSYSDEWGNNKLISSFNIDSGFTKLNYSFEDSTSVIMKLNEIRYDGCSGLNKDVGTTYGSTEDKKQ